MLAKKMAAHALGRKLRTDEAEEYRVKVGDILPHVPSDQRDAVGVRMRLSEEGLLLALGTGESGEGVRLTSTPQKLGGVRWWFICPKCGKRAASIYWLGHGERGWWQCRQCCGLRYSSSSLHKTPQGDLLTLRGVVRSGPDALFRAMERQARRRAKLTGGDLLDLADLPEVTSWEVVKAGLMARAEVQ